MAHWRYKHNPEQEPQLLRGFPCKQLTFEQRLDKRVRRFFKIAGPILLSSRPLYKTAKSLFLEMRCSRVVIFAARWGVRAVKSRLRRPPLKQRRRLLRPLGLMSGGEQYHNPQGPE